MKKYTVDRFEGELAVLLLRDNETLQIDVLREQLPSKTKEGDILYISFKEDGSVKDAKLLKEETESAKNTAAELLQKLINKNKK